jgi:serine/threonine protein phosphatase 1
MNQPDRLDRQKGGIFRKLFGGFRSRRLPPCAPKGERLYVVGDIHGRLDLLNALLDKVKNHAHTNEGKNTIVYVGDYIDRGPNSRGVVDRVLQSIPGFTARYLRGNHDQAVLDFLADPLFYRVWKNYGAPETLVSYGVRPPLFDDPQSIVQTRNLFASSLPPDHRRFFENLELSVEAGDYFIVHAGVRPGIGFESQSAQDMMWIREEFLLSGRDHGKVVVHGHTPTTEVIRRKNRIGIDTGAYMSGYLTALVLEGESVEILQT